MNTATTAPTIKTEEQQVFASIRENFPGVGNTGLRKMLRDSYADNGAVSGIGQRVALSYSGHLGLANITKLIRVLEWKRTES